MGTRQRLADLEEDMGLVKLAVLGVACFHCEGSGLVDVCGGAFCVECSRCEGNGRYVPAAFNESVDISAEERRRDDLEEATD